MIKDEFNKLGIDNQVEYLNINLREGLSLTKVCKNIGIARSTVGGRVSKQGYIFNKEINQYVLKDKPISGRPYSKLTVSNHLTTENKAFPQDDKLDYLNTESNIVSKNITNCNNENSGLILNSIDSDNLTYLLKNIDILKDFIEGNKSESSNNQVNSLEDIVNDIYKFKQEKRNYKVKSLRIDENILSDFETIASELYSKGINQQEFLNYILKSYIDFYKNFEL
ncbi:DNA-binding protein [Paraclostridium ghonii]|uniref:DNA-binding protein n=1 Tax=Paraclostridium ghonii TaxID=29358 RepID=A0ABU0N452_9FIRM|nr:hypothetical protein [Paeniclostridium ghonii]MDQ0557942.1 hypothetical protein [Paeniclostridium ghonii]